MSLPAGPCDMDIQEKKDCLGWLLGTASVRLLWSRDLRNAADNAAAECRTQILAYLAESAYLLPYPDWHLEPGTLGRSQCMAAAGAGQLHVLAWLRDHVDSQAWSPSVCRAAIQANQMEALQWLCCVCQCDCDEATLSYAAGQGKLEALKILQSSQPPCLWNATVCAEAVKHPDCLQWLRQQDPPFAPGTETVQQWRLK